LDEKQKRLSLSLVSDEQDAEGIDYYKRHMAASSKTSSGSLGTLGDILRARMDEKKD
jgi:hypothetical protein